MVPDARPSGTEKEVIMKDQVVQVYYHIYGAGVNEYVERYKVDTFGELIAAVRRDLEHDWYASMVWINSVEERFEVIIDEDNIEIYDEEGNPWYPVS